MLTTFRRWFAGSFWLDCHYTSAVLATVVAVFRRPFDGALASFAVGLWVSAAGNDKVNMPPV